MPNFWAINEFEINWSPIPTEAELGDFSFDNFDLQNATIKTIVSPWVRNYPNRDINQFSAPQVDWMITNSIFFRWRNIQLNWWIEWTDLEDLNNQIDIFKTNLSGKLKLLKWKVNWVIRQLSATVSNITFWDINNIIIPYDLTFTSPDPYWYNPSNLSKVLAFSSSPFPDFVSLSNLDTFPTMVFAFWTWLSSVTQTSIKVDWIWITINQAISDNDFLEIKWIEKEVLYNWVKIDYDWIFPLFKKGVNSVEYTINWTFSVNVNIIYRNNLL